MTTVLTDIVARFWPNAMASAAPLAGVASMALLALLLVALVALVGPGHRARRAMAGVYGRRDRAHAEQRAGHAAP